MEKINELTTGIDKIPLTISFTYKGPDAVAKAVLTIMGTRFVLYADRVFNGRVVTLFEGDSQETLRTFPKVDNVEESELARIVLHVEHMFCEQLRLLDHANQEVTTL